MVTILEKQFIDDGIREVLLQEKTIKNLKFFWNYLRKNKIQFNTEIMFEGGLISAKAKSTNACRLSEYVDFLKKYLGKMEFFRISFFVYEKDLDLLKLEGLKFSNYKSQPHIFIR